MYKYNICTILLCKSHISRMCSDIIIVILIYLFSESVRTYEPDLADDQSVEGNFLQYFNIIVMSTNVYYGRMYFLNGLLFYLACTACQTVLRLF